MELFFGSKCFEFQCIFMENMWKLTEVSHIVFGCVHFDQNASNFDKHTWKTLDNWQNRKYNNIFITKFFDELPIQWNVYPTFLLRWLKSKPVANISTLMLHSVNFNFNSFEPKVSPFEETFEILNFAWYNIFGNYFAKKRTISENFCWVGSL